MGEDFLAGTAQPDFTEHEVDLDLGRSLDLETLDALLAAGMDRYAERAADSDRWLAPRVHATIRLRRSEAADYRLWAWLAAVKYPDYIRWRFPGRAPSFRTPVHRFFGQDRDNGLSRLWWGAELTRNGGSYAPTVAAFERQDIPSTWFSLDAFHNRAAALAALRMLPVMGSKPINSLSQALNHYLTTIMLDAVAPMSWPDEAAMREWIGSTVEVEDLILDALPAGPQDDEVDPSAIAAVEALLRRVAIEMGIDLSEDPTGADTE
jgi:hypothetical protein